MADAPAKPHNSETLNDEIAELNEEIESLRGAYEQFFIGIERRPPSMRHERLKKRVVAVQTSTVRQTASKFKAQTLNNKLLTYERLWQRTLKEIEDGTYVRDVYKAKLHRKDDPAPPPPAPAALAAAAAAAAKPGAQVAASAAAKPGAPAVPGSMPGIAPPGASAQRAPVAAPSGQLSDAKLHAIYDAYVMAKKRCNEDVSKLSFDSVANTLRQQVPALIKQHNAKSVEFKVVIKDGKAVLRALPKE